MKVQKPGMRNIKTGLGVMICVLIGSFNIIDSTFFAATACIVSMQTTVKSSLTTGLNRLKGTLIGGIIGFLFVLIAPENPILSFLGIITTIYVCNVLEVNKSVTIACVVFSAILLNIGNNNPLKYSISRTWDTSIGVIVGVAVNYFIYRPNYLNRIYNEIKVIEKTSINLLKSEIEKGPHADISSLSKEIKKLEGLYKNFFDELEYANHKFDSEEIKNAINKCKEIYLHLQILNKMNGKYYINQENYMKSQSICDELAEDIEVKDHTSIVYNYHIAAIIKNINEIHGLEDEVNYERSNKEVEVSA